MVWLLFIARHLQPFPWNTPDFVKNCDISAFPTGKNGRFEIFRYDLHQLGTEEFLLFGK